jgi:hypothetical protein
MAQRTVNRELRSRAISWLAHAGVVATLWRVSDPATVESDPGVN